MPTARPSRQTLEATPLRALPFLSALSRNPMIFNLLKPRGYTLDEHNAGWALFLKAAGYKVTATADTVSFQSEARQAQLELDQWDEPNFRVAQGALRRKHPAQHDFVFEGGLEAAAGAASIVSVSIFLDRLDALEASPERESTRADDLATLETLAQRGIDATERQRLRALLAHAQSLPSLAGLDPEQAAAQQAQREEDLFALYLWHKDWSGTAATVIKRRDYLVHLGLATRRSPQADEET